MWQADIERSTDFVIDSSHTKIYLLHDYGITEIWTETWNSSLLAGENGTGPRRGRTPEDGSFSEAEFSGMTDSMKRKSVV